MWIRLVFTVPKYGAGNLRQLIVYSQNNKFLCKPNEIYFVFLSFSRSIFVLFISAAPRIGNFQNRRLSEKEEDERKLLETVADLTNMEPGVGY